MASVPLAESEWDSFLLHSWVNHQGDGVESLDTFSGSSADGGEVAAFWNECGLGAASPSMISSPSFAAAHSSAAMIFSSSVNPSSPLVASPRRNALAGPVNFMAMFSPLAAARRASLSAGQMCSLSSPLAWRQSIEPHSSLLSSSPTPPSSSLPSSSLVDSSSSCSSSKSPILDSSPLSPTTSLPLSPSSSLSSSSASSQSSNVVQQSSPLSSSQSSIAVMPNAQQPLSTTQPLEQILPLQHTTYHQSTPGAVVHSSSSASNLTHSQNSHSYAARSDSPPVSQQAHSHPHAYSHSITPPPTAFISLSSGVEFQSMHANNHASPSPALSSSLSSSSSSVTNAFDYRSSSPLPAPSLPMVSGGSGGISPLAQSMGHSITPPPPSTTNPSPPPSSTPNHFAALPYVGFDMSSHHALAQSQQSIMPSFSPLAQQYQQHHHQQHQQLILLDDTLRPASAPPSSSLQHLHSQPVMMNAPSRLNTSLDSPDFRLLSYSHSDELGLIDTPPMFGQSSDVCFQQEHHSEAETKYAIELQQQQQHQQHQQHQLHQHQQQLLSQQHQHQQQLLSQQQSQQQQQQQQQHCLAMVADAKYHSERFLVDGDPAVPVHSSNLTDGESFDAIGQFKVDPDADPNSIGDSDGCDLNVESNSIDANKAALARRARTREQFLDISHVLTMRQRHAASTLGIAQSSLSKRWKAATNGRKWPWKEVKTIDKELAIIFLNMPDGNCPPEQVGRINNLLQQRKHELRPVFIRL